MIIVVVIVVGVPDGPGKGEGGSGISPTHIMPHTHCRRLVGAALPTSQVSKLRFRERKK